MDKRVLISTTTFAEFEKRPLELLEKENFTYILNPYRRKLKAEEIVELGKDVRGIIAGTESLTEAVLEKMPGLKVISRCGAGLDNVDGQAARERGVKVYNTPDAPTQAVAELVVGLMLNLLRQIRQADDSVRCGRWHKAMGNLLYNKKVGIIGLGRIGRKVVEIAKVFSCPAAYTDPNVAPESVDVPCLSLQDLLKWADIITVHASGKERIMGKEELSKMREGALLVNTSRGGVIDEDALYQALKQGHLGGCALDVFEEEPYSGPLRELDNVLFTPHIGSYARETRIAMEREAVEHLIEGMKDGNRSIIGGSRGL